MAVTKIVLDRQAIGKAFTFGDTSATGQAALVIEKGTAAVTALVLDVKGSQTIRGNLAVEGNFDITGDINRTSVTELQVTDKTIRVNNGGTTAGAGGSGLVVEGDADAIIGQIIYDGALASRFKLGVSGAEKEIADLSSTQTFTNKSISGGQITSAVANATLAATATVALGLKSATTTVDVQTATAPTAGQVLTATSTTAATWQTPVAVGVFKRTTITGTQDGSNKIFTIGNSLAADSDQVIFNGQVLNPGAANDYTLSGTTLTFTAGFTAPASTDVIQVMGSY